jgi:type II secretory pathway component GspD/PulD (secretin)
VNSLLPLVFWLVLLTSPVFAESRVFDLEHRRAEEVAASLRGALGGTAKVVPVGRGLLVSAPAAELTVAAELIDRLDRPAQMLRITVAQDQRDNRQESAAGGMVAGRFGDASINIGTQPPSTYPSGGGVIISGESGVAAGDVTSGRGTESRRVEQFLVTIEGSPARISVGQRLPLTERWLLLARRHLQVVESTRYQIVETGFEVTPTLLPMDQVELAIHPFMAFLATGAGQQIRFGDLETRVVISLGTWFDLGGTMSDRDEVSREILGVMQGRYGESGGVRVRVEHQAN